MDPPAVAIRANLLGETCAKTAAAILDSGGVAGGIGAGLGAAVKSNSGIEALAGAVATAVFAVPVFFAAILFALEFRVAESPSAALGANMLAQ